MAYRLKNCWSLIANSLGGGRHNAINSGYATSTAPRMKAYAPAGNYYGRIDHPESRKPRTVLKGGYVSVFASIGSVVVQMAIGVFTMAHMLRNCPNVTVRKKRREMVAEVDEPELVAEESDKFFRKSLFRKIAHVQEYDNAQHAVPDAIRGDAYAYNNSHHMETLRDVGVDPKLHSS